MVISYYGALNAFLTIYNYLPPDIPLLIILGLMIGGAIKLLVAIKDL